MGSQTTRQQQGERSREAILDSAETLMATRGYSGTTIAAVRQESGLPASSIYWHFGSKEGLLAAVMERGADRWFESLPRRDDLELPLQARLDALLAAGADALDQHPEFLRLFYILSLETGDGDDRAREVVYRVRSNAIERFREGIEQLLVGIGHRSVASSVATELTQFAVAFSDGCFFAAQLEPGDTDLRRMYALLGSALRELAPILIERQGSAIRATEDAAWGRSGAAVSGQMS